MIEFMGRDPRGRIATTVPRQKFQFPNKYRDYQEVKQEVGRQLERMPSF
jgi:hypothetical protein